MPNPSKQLIGHDYPILITELIGFRCRENELKVSNVSTHNAVA
jgi:hypothetical protein